MMDFERFLLFDYNIPTMAEAEKLLNQWALIDVKNKDLFHKRIASIKEEEETFTVTQNDLKIIVYSAMPELKEVGKIKELKKNDSDLTIVALNNKENLDFLLKNWKQFSEIKGLSFWFVNPLSNMDKKWVINPHVHSKICDDESLEIGLRAIAEGVEVIDTSDFLIRIKEILKD